MNREEIIQSMEETTCCIVGGGPAGAVLSLLLARQGVKVMLLESHKDFDRSFRGDTIHPHILEELDKIGLTERLLEIPHTKMSKLIGHAESGDLVFANFSHMKIKFPYIAVIHQAEFLKFITEEAKRYPNFKLVMEAKVDDLIQKNGNVDGVRYRIGNHRHEVRASLTVAADGRYSRLRRLAGMEAKQMSASVDVLWFRLPRSPEDQAKAYAAFGKQVVLGVVDRMDHWQIGYIIPKGAYQEIRSKGLNHLRNKVSEIIPQFADKVEKLVDWKQIAVLSVLSDRLTSWHKPGLLFIGDAAHAMSPVAGAGINYAIQDAFATSNVLADKLRAEVPVTEDDLSKIQSEREVSVKLFQAFQNMVQKRVLDASIQSSKPFSFPALLRFLQSAPYSRTMVTRLIGFGFRPTYLKQ